jgi:hypothetical protein
MQRILLFIGAILVALGLIWLLQSVGILPDGFMSGNVFWARLGAVTLVAGLVLCGFGLREDKSPE